ncbi:MAG: glutamate--tRNA ligase [Pyrinomonadaceae bacterium]
MTVRVRFAPSPTGYLHIGSARTALFNYLFARHVGGKFLLRVEDTDLARSTDESTRSILEGLAWLGLAPDEETIFQSDNADKHRAAARRLLEVGRAYRDFTPKKQTSDKNVKEAIAERARQHGADRDMRDNPYRELSKEESDARAAAGEPFAIRLKVPAAGKTSFEDAVYGLQERDYSEIEDLVLLRSDGHPLYNLAVVCDDIEMGITHVIRGQDHLTNTHKQILIYEALGEEPPKFAHLPLILAPNKGKLSKRKHGEIVSLTTYRDAGFIPQAFVNFLALLGWSAGEEKEIYSMPELIEKFSLEGIHRSNAVFNFHEGDAKRWTDDKAIWMNAEYIRTMPLADLLPLVKEELRANKLWREEYEDAGQNHPRERAGSEPRETGSSEWFEHTVDLIRQRFFTLKDFSSQGRAYFSEDFDFDPAAVEKNLKKFPDLQTWLPELAVRFEAEFADRSTPFIEEHIERVVKQFTEEKGTKLGVIMNGARTMLTGVAVGPSMLSVFETIGLERTVMRLRSKVAWDQ